MLPFSQSSPSRVCIYRAHIATCKMVPTYNIRASLFFKSIKAIICTPKMVADDAIAVRRATRLIPSEPCAAVVVVEDAAAEVVVALPVKTEDMLSNVEHVSDA